MSNALAVATVTLTLKDLIATGLNRQQGFPALQNLKITTKVPDEARKGHDGDQVNLFLFHVSVNPHWRNRDLPGGRPGESRPPLLPLDLMYLVTAFAAENDGVREHQLLGRVMSVLHDHPSLSPADIKAVIDNPDQEDLQSSDLHRQADRVKITPNPLNLEQVARLWSGAHSQYRNSVVYEASPVLIESTRPMPAPLPVLRRGRHDPEGADVHAGFNYPELLRVEVPRGKPMALLPYLEPKPPDADYKPNTLVLLCANFPDESSTDTVSLLFRHALVPGGRERKVAAQPTRIEYTIPANERARWPAGVWTVSAVIRSPGADPQERRTNSVPFILLPSITINPVNPANDKPHLEIEVQPPLAAEQRAVLLLDKERIPSPDPGEPRSKFVLDLSGIKGKYFARLRIDGVDSLPYDPRDYDPKHEVPHFDHKLQVSAPLKAFTFKADATQKVLMIDMKPPLPADREVDLAVIVGNYIFRPKGSSKNIVRIILKFGDGDVPDDPDTLALRVEAKDVPSNDKPYPVYLRIDQVDYDRDPYKLKLPIPDGMR